MSLESDVRNNQKDHFSQEKSAHISVDDSDTERYANSVANAFHKRRREMWRESYKINYRNRHKDQKRMRKNELD